MSLEVVQCIDCGLVQLTNAPVDYYQDVITAAALSPKSKDQLKQEWQPIITKHSLQGKPAIEIGSGTGDFLEVLKHLGLVAIGLEHSQTNVHSGQAKSLNVQKGYLLDNQPLGKFALVVCNNYLEHQPQTGTFLKTLASLLEDDGILYLSVPNLEYLLRKSCLYEFVADHLVYFTRDTLRLACEISGLVVIDQYQKNNDNDLVLIAAKRKPLCLTDSIKIVDEISRSLKQCVVRAKEAGKTIAVWGAGHRALALMAISDLIEIDFIVDSATFKQGNFTPLLRKRIVSPAELIKNGCDLLIVMLPGNFAKHIETFIVDNNLSCEVIFFEDKKLTV
ncbi:class I SAM-dependent methyltransferase [Jezberella montanilacus]|uniref:class I SAM-dependent methyltransferase n=1 Tax=Jezberella montanilacus TaxID=323426 RepID=UPI002180C7EB|nr:class I SAM-dependent methyltransferase [Jezberella montanilacus]